MRIHGHLGSRLLRAVLVLLVCLGALRPGAARAADDPQRAKELFQEGTTFFDLGQFEKAIESWQQGYKAKPDPGFLYNIAQAYRLAGDAQKSIFFYKGYLRNSPKAHNRAEVEQKIAALQKQAADQEKNKSAPPTGPTRLESTPGASPGVAPAVAAGTPPSASPAPGPALAAGEPPPTTAPPAYDSQPAPPTVRQTPPAPQGAAERRFDLAAGIGTDLWASGVQGTAQPSFAFTLAGGYTFAGAPDGALRFRLGAFFGYTFLDEPGSKETFVSLLVDPSLRIRLAGERLFLTADVGIGLLAIGGLKPGSSLLARNETLMISGAQSMLELRPAMGLEFGLLPSLALFAGPAIAYSPKRPHFYAPISRVELVAGLLYRL